jgi:predicted metal-dependent hydrolase
MDAPLTVRRLHVDLETPFAPRWNGGDSFRTAYFNALSMSFPAGEQFFIDAVRAGTKLLPPAERERFEREAQGFVGQEATHRRVHALFNAQLARQGHVNAWEPRLRRRLARLEGAHPRHAVAITAATEHFTAILAEHLLAHPQVLAGAEPRLRRLWLWHAAEESEHRSTAFDLYRALGGNERWRRRWFALVTWHFLGDVLRQTVRNLAHDGALWRPSTWRSAASFFFGRGGLVRETLGPWAAYWRAGFHPRQQGGALGAQWLMDNSEDYTSLR